MGLLFFTPLFKISVIIPFRHFLFSFAYINAKLQA
jgi:hypothetical protein